MTVAEHIARCTTSGADFRTRLILISFYTLQAVNANSQRIHGDSRSRPTTTTVAVADYDTARITGTSVAAWPLAVERVNIQMRYPENK